LNASIQTQVRMVAIDLPGLGHSQRRDELLAPRAMGEFVIRLADVFGLENPHVVGPTLAPARRCSPPPCIRTGCAAWSSGGEAWRSRCSWRGPATRDGHDKDHVATAAGTIGK
jgi:hypothetical protein